MTLASRLCCVHGNPGVRHDERLLLPEPVSPFISVAMATAEQRVEWIGFFLPLRMMSGGS